MPNTMPTPYPPTTTGCDAPTSSSPQELENKAPSKPRAIQRNHSSSPESWFGTRRSELRILSPRPFIYSSANLGSMPKTGVAPIPSNSHRTLPCILKFTGSFGARCFLFIMLFAWVWTRDQPAGWLIARFVREKRSRVYCTISSRPCRSIS